MRARGVAVNCGIAPFVLNPYKLYLLWGMRREVAMKLAFHKTHAMLTRHNIVDERDLEEAVKKLERRNSDSVSQSTVKVGVFPGTIERVHTT